MPEVRESMSSLPLGQWSTVTPEETFALGEKIGRELKGGEVLMLSGPLGAGKTILVKGIASALGIDPEEVTSPTFSLVNPYRGGPVPFYHLDLYRLDEGESAARAVDLEELLTDSGAVLIIEWAERLGNYRLPSTTWIISIRGDGDDPRTINVTPKRES